MNNVIELDGMRGRLDAGIPRRMLEALMLASRDLTFKEIAREMIVSPSTVKQMLDDARFKLGMQRSVRGACLEAFRRGIVSPLALALVAVLAIDGHSTANIVRRPPQQRRVEMCITASRFSGELYA